MKRFFWLAFLPLLAELALGQGQVLFNNLDKAHGIYAIVTDGSGSPVSGTAARVALLGGPASTGVPYRWDSHPGDIYACTAGNLTMLASPNTGITWVNFRTGAAGGYVDVGTDSPRILNDVGYNSPAMLQMVAWTGGWNDWVTAWNAFKADPGVGAMIGLSAPWIVTTTLSPIDMQFAPNVGLQPFQLALPIPEPSVIALAGLAAAGLFGFRQQERRG